MLALWVRGRDGRRGRPARARRGGRGERRADPRGVPPRVPPRASRQARREPRGVRPGHRGVRGAPERRRGALTVGFPERRVAARRRGRPLAGRRERLPTTTPNANRPSRTKVSRGVSPSPPTPTPPTPTPSARRARARTRSSSSSARGGRGARAAISTPINVSRKTRTAAGPGDERGGTAGKEFRNATRTPATRFTFAKIGTRLYATTTVVAVVIITAQTVRMSLSMPTTTCTASTRTRVAVTATRTINGGTRGRATYSRVGSAARFPKTALASRRTRRATTSSPWRSTCIGARGRTPGVSQGHDRRLHDGEADSFSVRGAVFGHSIAVRRRRRLWVGRRETPRV
jgi:hypothetical protein